MWSTIKNHFKQSKRLMTYVFAISGISLMVPMAAYAFARDSMGLMLKITYSFILLLMCTICFIEANTIGNKNRKKTSLYKPYKVKGFFLGLAAELPVWAVTFISLCLRDNLLEPFSSEARNYIANFFTLQFTPVTFALNYTVLGYAASMLILPAVCMSGYLLSYAGINIDDSIGGIHKS